jgi:hypothetical protein
LLGVAALAVASLAGNVYLGWSFLGARARYLEVLDELDGHSHVIDTDEEADTKRAEDDDDEDDENGKPTDSRKSAKQMPAKK